MTTPEAVTFTDIEARNQERETTHVCGNCRNPWTRFGRADCPNARRDQ